MEPALLSTSVKKFGLLIVLLFQATLTLAQNFTITQTDIKVGGIARDKPWLMTANAAEGGADFIFRENKLIEVKNLKFELKTANLKSDYVKMDQRAYRALKAYPFDKIRYSGKYTRIAESEPGTYILLSEGNLIIGGITQIIKLEALLSLNADGTLTCSGSNEILRSKFNVTLPAAEERVMSISDEIEIEFCLRLTSTKASFQ